MTRTYYNVNEEDIITMPFTGTPIHHEHITPDPFVYVWRPHRV